MTATAQDRTLKLVATAYGAAIRPDRFDDLLQAWDDWFDAMIDDSAQAFAEVSGVFDDAIDQADHLRDSAPRNVLEHSPVPTVLLDGAEQIVAMNNAATNLFEEAALDPARVLAARQPTAEPFGNSKHKTFRLAGGAGLRSYLAVEAPAYAGLAADHPTAQSVMYLSLMDWNPAFAREVGQRLDLSAAELRVARGLLEGRTAQEISGDLGRSLPTIRSHIKSLLLKTGARRQAELVQFLTILRQVSDVVPPVAKDAAQAGFEQIELTGPAGRLEVIRYGSGRPVLYFTTSSLPEETEAFRAAMTAAGFAVIAPVRPGFRGSTAWAGDASEGLLDNWLDMLLALCGPNPLIAGHREAGVLAAQTAARILAKGGQVSGLALLSTGAPVSDLTHFDGAPPSVRRSFLTAHVAAPALRLGYQTAARLFRNSKLGQDQLIRFFHKDSPADRQQLGNPVFYETTRDILNFCFEDTDQIVRDIEVWGSDWSADLHAVTKAAPVLFVHGSQHVFQPLEGIKTLVSGKENPRLLAIEGSGQFAIYDHPDRVAQALSALGR
ncbi:MAG: LuxR C-terminal-related transcriptional regulator [Pseudomonadota bacterium]